MTNPLDDDAQLAVLAALQAETRARMTTAPQPAPFAVASPFRGVAPGPGPVTYSRLCPDCGVSIQMARNAPTTRCPPCAALEAGARRRRLHAAALSRIPETFAGVAFGTVRLESAVRSEEARTLAERYGTFAETALVLLLGPTGAGKTTLAAAIFRAQVDRVAEGRTPTTADEYFVANLVWTHARSIAAARRQSPLGEEPPLLAACRRASVLVVDDLGQESPADKDELIEIISWREERLRPTVVTCGFDLGADPDGGRYGAHFERRLTERKGVVIVGGTS